MIELYEIVFEKYGTLYTTTSDVDHSFYCDINDEYIRPMDTKDIERLIERLKKQLTDNLKEEMKE